MSWTRDDIKHSVRRYVVATLGEPWVYRFERREITNDGRPMGLVDLGPSRTTRARSSRIQGSVERAAPLTLTLYPPVGEDPRAASREADRVAQRVHDLIDIGMSFSAPHRVPLYDYSTWDAGEPSPSAPYDYLWVSEDFTVRSIQDPIDARRYAVVAELTLTWESAGRVAPSAPVVQGVPGAWAWPQVKRVYAPSVPSAGSVPAPTVVRL